jgi:stalled ribosome alternative rescue factor ArfA
MKKKKLQPRNIILKIIQQEDPERLRQRVVRPEKGKGRKNRPRNNKTDDCFDYAA